MTDMNRSIACALVLAAACGSSSHHSADAPGGADAPAGPPTAVVVAGSYMAGQPGIMSVVDVDAKTVRMNVAPQGAVGDDPMLRQFGNELFVVNRADSSNVTILNAQTFALVEQLSTGTNSNPQDVAVQGNKLFVPTLNGKGVAVLTRGSQAIDTIDLSADDPDGKPNCVSAWLVSDDLYVACELLDDTNVQLPPRGPGKVYVVNLASMLITHTITMQTPNPFGVFEQLPAGDLVIPTVDFNAQTGCIEKITTGATPASAGCMVMNSQLMGFASGLSPVQIGQAAILWIAVSAWMYPNANLQAYDLSNDLLWGQPLSPTSEEIVSVAACSDGRVAVTDPTMGASGVREYINTSELTSAPLSVGLATINANALVCY